MGKDISRLSRTELVEIIYALQQREKGLRARINTLEARLSEKELKIKNAGSIADAAIAVNRVVEKAQDAADQYLASIYSAEPGNITAPESGRGAAPADDTYARAEEATRALLQETEKRCSDMIRKANDTRSKVERQCRQLKANTDSAIARSLEDYRETLRHITEQQKIIDSTIEKQE